jgi:hypothetical protein
MYSPFSTGQLVDRGGAKGGDKMLSHRGDFPGSIHPSQTEVRRIILAWADEDACSLIALCSLSDM